MTRHVTRMEIDDALHIPAERRAAIIASYPAHEREARTRGIPMLGSGRVFAVAESAITCRAFAVPPHFACIGGIDFGYAHPTAAVKIAHDRDNDVAFVTNCYRVAEEVIGMHALALKSWGDGLPFAWPHDGWMRDKQSGEATAAMYRKAGLNMLPSHACFEDGSAGLEAGLVLVLERMRAARLLVFEHLEPWLAEFRTYHRKDGVVVKEADDVMSATRYALMSLRFAKVPTPRRHASNPTSYSTNYGVLR